MKQKWKICILLLLGILVCCLLLPTQGITESFKRWGRKRRRRQQSEPEPEPQPQPQPQPQPPTQTEKSLEELNNKITVLTNTLENSEVVPIPPGGGK
jgi:hypothetical protein